MSDYPEYLGMSYELASRECARLIEKAHETGNWVDLSARLGVLGEIMNREDRKVVMRPPLNAKTARWMG